ncbi:MAG: T9SS type A sorting domain-containing protein, partial [Flavobacteriaceae bacterium]|nr:T9SS type A sorting domain-containing protein [Flavobacteriaceae bacterium]
DNFYIGTGPDGQGYDKYIMDDIKVWNYAKTDIIALGINETAINLALSVCPNPTTDFLTLKVERTEGLTVLLYDLQGRVITNKTINSTSTNISLEAQPSAIYFLKVVKNNQIVEVFKILKN